MAKAWVYKRGRNKYVVFWRDAAGKLRSRTFPTRGEADEECRQRIDELRGGPGTVKLAWDDAVDKYLAYVRDTKGKEPETIRQYENTLANFRRLMGPVLPATFGEEHVELFIAKRRVEDTAAPTINKDLRHLKAFSRFCVRKKIMEPKALTIPWIDYWQTEVKRKPRVLDIPEWANLIRAARDIYGAGWALRIILAVTTGLRQQDIERLTVEDIDFRRQTLTTLNKKAHKFDDGKPMHILVLELLRQYVAKLPEGQTRLWSDPYHHSKWDRISERAGLPKLKYHALRASCATYVMEAGYSTSVAQDLLEHSTAFLTHQLYSNLSRVHQKAVNAIPLEKALEGLDLGLTGEATDTSAR